MQNDRGDLNPALSRELGARDLSREVRSWIRRFAKIGGLAREQVEGVFLSATNTPGAIQNALLSLGQTRIQSADQRSLFVLHRRESAGYEAVHSAFPAAHELYAKDWAAAREAERASARSVQAPPLDEFDPTTGELFLAEGGSGDTDLGIAWISNGHLWRTTLTAEVKRIESETEPSDRASRRASQDDRADRDKRIERLLNSLPFRRVRDALWPLPGDPTTESVREWEEKHGSLLAALTTYFERRVCTADRDGHQLMALWAMGAAARSEVVDFAPRLMIEAPYGWGKSTTAEAVQLVVPRTINGSSVSSAAAHRVMNELHPGLVVDESAIADNPDLQRVIRAGFKRGTRIIRASQNQDRGIVAVDPFGWMILTTQVDTKDDVVSRCYAISVSPGAPAVRVKPRDPEAKALRTVLTRLRFDIQLGDEYADMAEVTESAQTAAGLEPRSRDKLSSLWPFATRYGVQTALAATTARLEAEASSQLVDSDKGLVARAVAATVSSAGGIDKVRASDLELVRVHEELEKILIDMGEAAEVPLGHGEVAMRVDQRRYGIRDFTARLVRELGFKVRVAAGRARIDYHQFLAVWPTVSARYAGQSTLDEYSTGGGSAPPSTSGSVIPPIPTLLEGSCRDDVGVLEGSEITSPTGVDTYQNVGVGGVQGVDTPPGPAPVDGVFELSGGQLSSSAPSSGNEADRAMEQWRQEELQRIIDRDGPYIDYPSGVVVDRRTQETVWRPGDPPENRPRNPERGFSDKPHNSRRGL